MEVTTGKVVNLRQRAKLGDAVLVDRHSQWGNPFRIGKDGSRTEVVAKYRADLWRRIKAEEVRLDQLAELAGKELACWCDPLPCHAHVLARAAAWAKYMIDGRTTAWRR